MMAVFSHYCETGKQESFKVAYRAVRIWLTAQQTFGNYHSTIRQGFDWFDIATVLNPLFFKAEVAVRGKRFCSRYIVSQILCQNVSVFTQE